MSPQLTTREFVYRVFLVILMVILTLGLWYLREALLLIFLAFIIAIGLSKPIDMLRKRGFSRLVSTVITLAVTALMITLLFIALVPIFIEQVNTLMSEMPAALETTQNTYNDLAAEYVFLPELDSADDIEELNVEEYVLVQAGAASRNFFPFLSNVGGILTNIFVVLVMTVFILSQPDTYIEGFLTLLPRNYRPRALEIIQALIVAVQNSLVAQLFAMFFIGLLTTTGLMIIGVPNALALGVIAGLLNFIPTFGAIIALIIGVIFTLATAPDEIVLVVVLYLGLQQLESNYLTPRIVNTVLHMPGAVVIMTQIIAAILFGFLGIVLAVPLLAVIMVLIREIYVYDGLNSRKPEIDVVVRDDGKGALVISSNPLYRPHEMTPGEAAALMARGADPFEYTQALEIIPATRTRRTLIQGQQLLVVAVTGLVIAQLAALLRAILTERPRPR